MKYRLFGNTGLRVSELCFGTMGFGTEWGWGSDKEESRKIFDTFANADGNFFDTANRYTEGTSEKFLGEFIASDRDHFVIATKYTLKDRNGDLNFAGNHRKNLMRSVRDSLKRLNTEYIDILWMHAWDLMTPVDEIMRGFDDLVSRGLVHYIGVSDTPAWVVSQCNTLAQLRGWSQFAGLQVEYSLIQRTVEFDLFSMATAFGMTVTPWAPLGGGALTGKYLKGEKGRIQEGSKRLSERARSITQKVVEVAEHLGVTPAQVAINWTRQHRQLSMVPIIGATKVAHVEDMLGATKFVLPRAAFDELNEITKIDLPFPYSFFAEKTPMDVVYSGAREKLEDSRFRVSDY
ncbi:MAG: aldo/keto reductase [Bacteroidetes bacterium]|nr:aldo/keto reductase [Bacteroidota bacterium]